MTISVKMIEYSVHDGFEIATMQLRYPRFIHSEFMTHRMFSRNASSSRAVPVEKMIKQVEADPAMPTAWGSNRPGMQAGEELPNRLRQGVVDTWFAARDDAVRHARSMMELGAHKQIVNRILEPFAHISVVVTATEWDNFFTLRCHPDADPTIHTLAHAMRACLSASTPVERTVHLPYLSDQERELAGCATVSAARCARVSYLNHDGSAPDIDADRILAKRLLESKHMSPFEHQARVSDTSRRSGNFIGPWVQLRKELE